METLGDTGTTPSHGLHLAIAVPPYLSTKTQAIHTVTKVTNRIHNAKAKQQKF